MGTQRVDMTGGSNGINGFEVQLRWRETDISTASSTGSGSAATNTEAQTTGESQGSSGTSKSSGLSTGAKVGIGIGCAVAGILIIFFVIFMFLRSRRLGRQKESQSPTPIHECVRNTCPPAELLGSALTPHHELETASQEKDEFSRGAHVNSQPRTYVELESLAESRRWFYCLSTVHIMIPCLIILNYFYSLLRIFASTTAIQHTRRAPVVQISLSSCKLALSYSLIASR